MLNILNFFSGKKRLLALLAVILIAIVIPLTVIVSRQQQEIRQRASGGQISLYFANSGSCAPLTNINLTPNQPTPLSLCISAGTHTAGISGFNIALSASNSLTFLSASTTADADKFGSGQSPMLDGNKTIRFTRILITNNITDTPLRILDFAVLTTVAESGSIAIPTTQITSLTQDELLTVDNTPLSYNSAPSSTTSSKKVGESCIPTLAECESGSECVDYDELGYSICTSLPVSPTSIPTNTPTPAPVATIWIENPQANWDADGVIRRQVTEDAAKTFYLGHWSQVTGPLTPDIVAADRPLGTKSRFGTNIDSSGTSTTVYPSTISYITPTLAPTTTCTTNADCPAPPSCYSGAQKNCLNGGTANATCFYTSSSGTCQITKQTNTCTSVCVATPTPTPTSAPATTQAPAVSLKSKGDFNDDGIINLLDYNKWRGDFLAGTADIFDFNTWRDGFKDPSLPHEKK